SRPSSYHFPVLPRAHHAHRPHSPPRRSPDLVGARPYTVQRLTLGSRRDGTLLGIRQDVASSTSVMEDWVESSITDVLDATSCRIDRKSTRLNSSHLGISYAVFCLKKKKNNSN